MSADELLVFTGPYLHKSLGLAPISRLPYVACIRGFFRWAHSRGLVRHNAAHVVSYPKTGRKLPRAASLEVAEQLMWAPNFSTFEGVRDAAMLGVLIGCGLRVTGLCDLNESDLITQTIKGEPRLALPPAEKGKKERLIPLPHEADLLLRVYLEHPQLAAIDRQLPDDGRSPDRADDLFLAANSVAGNHCSRRADLPAPARDGAADCRNEP